MRMTVLGVDIGGHTIKAGIVTKTGKIKEKVVLLTEADMGSAAVVNNILLAINQLLEKERSVTAIGVGVPGIVDEEGYIIYTPNIPLSDYNLGKELKEEFGLPLKFGNDADNFALAKLKFGAAKGKKTVVTLTLGTGVGSGLILNGEVFSNKGAPELGHTTINYKATESDCCKNDGCIESFIGRKSFPGGPLEAYKRALQGNKAAIKRFEEYGKMLGIAIANFCNIFNPELVILGGELRNAHEFFKDAMEKEVEKRSLFKTKIIKNKMKQAGVVGAAALWF